MSFTQTDYDSVKAAYLATLKGERTVSFTIGDKSVEKTNPRPGEIRALLTEIEADLQATAGRPSYVLQLLGVKSLFLTNQASFFMNLKDSDSIPISIPITKTSARLSHDTFKRIATKATSPFVKNKDFTP